MFYSIHRKMQVGKISLEIYVFMITCFHNLCSQSPGKEEKGRRDGGGGEIEGGGGGVD